MVDKLFLMSF